MTTPGGDGEALWARALEADRIHSSYLVTGPGEAPRQAALRFVRSLVCQAAPDARPCEACRECRRSAEGEAPIELDGQGKRGPLLRHVGDHPDLFWLERGAADTRVRMEQIRELQSSLRLGSHEGGWRAAVVADAEWMSPGSQNALLRLLEEPPPRTCLLLLTPSVHSLLATIRSRCQRVRLPRAPATDLRGPDLDEKRHTLVQRMDGLPGQGEPALLDWAEEYRGDRATAAAGVQVLLEVAHAWLHEQTRRRADEGAPRLVPVLDAARHVDACRRDLERRNANPQMVAERALLALRDALA